MRILIFCFIAYAASGLAFAQEVTLIDAEKELDAARDELKKVVSMCQHCRGTGAIEEKTCPHCGGRGAMLRSEAKLVAHRMQLEQTAERKGVSKDKYADFDIADRLTKYEEKYESEAFELLKAYVSFVKVYRKHRDLISEDERLARQVEQTIKQLDKLIDRHGPSLVIRSLGMLYQDDPTGKVGAFKLYGKKGVVRIEGEDADRLEMRTLKNHAVLLIKSQAKPRNGFILAEIVGKDTYKTGDGKEIRGILLRAY